MESSLVAAQNALTVTPTPPQPQKQAEQRQQQAQRQTTELPVTQVVARQASAESFEQAEKFRQQQSFQDQSGTRASDAINAYTSLATEQRRAEIQQLLGVDTYA